MILKEVDVALSISMTTREQRPGEVEGESYLFISVDEFERIKNAGGFLEYAKVFGNYYGTPKEEVLKKLEEGKDVILEIDIQGAAQIKEKFPDGIFVFCLPPSIAELKNRIIKRGVASDDVVKLRTSGVLDEVSHIDKYDYCIINDDLQEAVDALKAIITATTQNYKVSDYVYELIEKFKEEINALPVNK